MIEEKDTNVSVDGWLMLRGDDGVYRPRIPSYEEQGVASATLGI